MAGLRSGAKVIFSKVNGKNCTLTAVCAVHTVHSGTVSTESLALHSVVQCMMVEQDRYV